MCSWKIKSPAIYTGRNTEICFKRVLSNSYIEQVFNVAVPFYNDILDKCGYYQKLTFDKNSAHMKEKIEGETSSGTSHYLVKMLKPTLRNSFYTNWMNILIEIINITRSSIVILLCQSEL